MWIVMIKSLRSYIKSLCIKKCHPDEYQNTFYILLYHLLIRYIIFVGNRNGIRTDIKIIYLIIYYYMIRR